MEVEASCVVRRVGVASYLSLEYPTERCYSHTRKRIHGEKSLKKIHVVRISMRKEQPDIVSLKLQTTQTELLNI